MISNDSVNFFCYNPNIDNNATLTYDAVLVEARLAMMELLHPQLGGLVEKHESNTHGVSDCLRQRQQMARVDGKLLHEPPLRWLHHTKKLYIKRHKLKVRWIYMYKGTNREY